MKTRISAVILAAGESRRMGQPKLLLPWGKTSVLGQVIETLSAAELTEMVVVTGGWHSAVEAEAARLAQRQPVRTVFNPNYAAGEMLSSVQRGLRALPPECEAALIALGDQPQMQAWVVRKVIEAFAQDGAALVIPSWRGRRGHPVLVARTLWDEILALNPPHTLRDLFSRLPVTYVAGDESILRDLDTPDAYMHEKP